MKASLKCPSCGDLHPQPITDTKDRYYCNGCKHVWIVGKEKESLNDKGSMQFNGIMPAKQLIDMISKNAELPATAQAAFVAQFTGSLFEQWYEGFKAGLLANIVHQRSKDDGENRSKQVSPDREHPNGDRPTGEQDEQDSIREQQTRKPTKGFERVKESIGGVEVIRPKNITLTDKQYENIAATINTLNKESIVRINVEGGSMYIVHNL